jgi:hypothetical protein
MTDIKPIRVTGDMVEAAAKLQVAAWRQEGGDVLCVVVVRQMLEAAMVVHAEAQAKSSKCSPREATARNSSITAIPPRALR